MIRSIPETKAISTSSFERVMLWIARHWMFLFGLLIGFYVLLPFLAPVLMFVGWNIPGKIIYGIYSVLCHQLPERSYFLFGPKLTYSLPEIQASWQLTNDPWVLRQFVGNPEFGWKVAWSDRMVAMFTSLWLFALLWWSFRRRIVRLPWWGLVLLYLPMALDGTSHIISDLSGIGQGFRDSNSWLAILTSNAMPAAFYMGDALGSFNSWMRLVTGILFGLGTVWYLFPLLEDAFTSMVQVIEYKGRSLALLHREKERILNGVFHE
jgi:uncharacterized membrane protein